MGELWQLAGYELLDFGRGRKLERLGPWVVDRPAPAASQAALADPAAWKLATARFERHDAQHGRWEILQPEPAAAEVRLGPLRLELRLTESGQVGVFPEQWPHCQWVSGWMAEQPGPVEALNLFAYTGALTLAAAGAGARVVHVDASHGATQWARQNAQLSLLGEAPVRWIVDDAAAFVAREARRGRRYQAIWLDPPTYGHGPRGQVWNLRRDLPGLLNQLAGLFDREQPNQLLVSCHAEDWSRGQLLESVRTALGAGWQWTALDSTLRAAHGRELAAGVAVRAVRR